MHPTAEADASYKMPGQFMQEMLEWVPGTGATSAFAVASQAFSSCGTVMEITGTTVGSTPHGSVLQSIIQRAVSKVP